MTPTGHDTVSPRPARARRGRGVERFRFALERWVLRGLHYRLLLAAAVVVAVALVAGLLVGLLDPGSREVGEDVWWAFLRLTDPGYLGDDEGLARRSISTAVTVLGYVLFLGLLIALLTQWLNGFLARLEAGITPVAIADHVVVLGWNSRTPTIVAELLATRGRVERFLARYGARELRIVVLAERVDGALLQELRERLGERWSERQVLLRSGAPLHLDHMERVAFHDAAVLILSGADFAQKRPELVDAQTVKTLMAVSKHAHASGSAPPLAVAELFDGRRARVAREAYDGECEILATDDIVSRIIAESVRQVGICSVFMELLTLGAGSALYVRHVEGLAGARFGDVCGSFYRAIVLGTVRPGSGEPALNPDPDTVLAAEDRLVFAAHSFDACAAGESEPGAAPHAPLPAARAAPASRRVLILGWSRKVPALLENFARYDDVAFAIDVVSATSLAERAQALERHGSEIASDRVRQIEAGFTTPGVLESLEPQRYDSVVLLASERLDERAQADATTVFAYLMLRRLLPEEGPRPHVFVELLDEENRFLFQGELEDVIVSPLLVSYLLSQVALRRELAAVFEELSRPAGPHIALASVDGYLPLDTPVGFEDLLRSARARGEIALGLRHRGGDLELDPDRDARWRLGAGDEVVVLRSPAATSAPSGPAQT